MNYTELCLEQREYNDHRFGFLLRVLMTLESVLMVLLSTSVLFKIRRRLNLHLVPYGLLVLSIGGSLGTGLFLVAAVGTMWVVSGSADLCLPAPIHTCAQSLFADAWKLGALSVVVLVLSLPLPTAHLTDVTQYGVASNTSVLSVCSTIQELANVRWIALPTVVQRFIELSCLVILLRTRRLTKGLLEGFALRQKDLPLAARVSLRSSLRINELLHGSILIQLTYSLVASVPFWASLLLVGESLRQVDMFVLVNVGSLVAETPALVLFLASLLRRLVAQDQKTFVADKWAGGGGHFKALTNMWER